MTAQIRIRDSLGAIQYLTRIRVRDVSGTLRTIKRVRGRDVGNILRVYFSDLSVEISPSTADGYIAGTTTQNISTGSVTGVVSGGTAPYTYAWSQTGTSPYTWTISAATAATTLFTALSVPVGVVATQTFRLTVTDASGNIALWDIFATARNNNSLSGGGSGEPYDPGGGGGGGGIRNPPREVY